MIQEILYKCEVCGQTYQTEQDARRCEDSHVEADYISYQHFPKQDKYPDTVILTMGNNHTLQYRFEKAILNIPSGQPYIQNVSVSRNESTNQVVLTAVGENLPDDDYTWVILFDETRVVLTSTTPTITLSAAATRLFDLAFIVRVKVDSPNVEGSQFVVKYTE